MKPRSSMQYWYWDNTNYAINGPALKPIIKIYIRLDMLTVAHCVVHILNPISQFPQYDSPICI